MRILMSLTSAIAIAAAMPVTAVQAAPGDQAQNHSERAQARAERRARVSAEVRQEARRTPANGRDRTQNPPARAAAGATVQASARRNRETRAQQEQQRADAAQQARRTEAAQQRRADARRTAAAEQRRTAVRQQAQRAEAAQQAQRAEAAQQRRTQARQQARRAEAAQQRRATAVQQARQTEAAQQRRVAAQRAQRVAEARQQRSREAARAQNRTESRTDRRRVAQQANALADRRAQTIAQTRAAARVAARRNVTARNRVELRRPTQRDTRAERLRAQQLAQYRERQIAARRLAERREAYRVQMLNQQRLAARVDNRRRQPVYAANFYRNQGWSQAAYRDRLNQVWQRQAREQARQRQVRAFQVYRRGDRWTQVDSGYRYSPTTLRRIVSYRQPAYFDRGGGYDYRYARGYAYQVDPQTQLIAALLPLLGGAFDIGQTIPAGYNVYNLPTQYRAVYPDGGAYNYRYGDSAIYRVDRSNGRILGVPTLLTSGFQVGQTIPAGYGAYNVPYDYRDQYYDTDAYQYRYNNGRIYQVDATTQLVTAAIDLLV